MANLKWGVPMVPMYVIAKTNNYDNYNVLVDDVVRVIGIDMSIGKYLLSRNDFAFVVTAYEFVMSFNLKH